MASFGAPAPEAAQPGETIRFEDQPDFHDVVQALLLFPFDDARDEEWTSSYAGNAARMDFLQKRGQVIFETKVMRTTAGKPNPREMTNQLIIDRERHQTYQDCKTLVQFVYNRDYLGPTQWHWRAAFLGRCGWSSPKLAGLFRTRYNSVVAGRGAAR